MFSRPTLFLLSALFLPLGLSAALADDQGINSVANQPLPIGASQGAGMTIFGITGTNASRNIAIGPDTTDPNVNLKVARGVMIGTDESFTGVGTSCTKPGTLSQGSPADGSLYLCAQKTAGVYAWKSLGSSGSVYGLQNLTMVGYGQTVQSNTLQYNAAGSAAVSVSLPGVLRINGGAWVTSGTINQGQTIQLQVTAPDANNANLTLTLTTGSETDTWSVTTAPRTFAEVYYACGQTWVCQLGTNCSQSYNGYNCDGQDGCGGKHAWGYLETYLNSASYSCSWSNGDNCPWTMNCTATMVPSD
jgi:hypothetical protein